MAQHADVGYGGLPYPTSVARSTSFVSSGALAITISGLTPFDNYNLSFLGSRDTSALDIRTTIYSVGGLSDTVTVSDNVSEIAVFANVQANASGEISATVDSSQQFAYINAMTIEGDFIAVPEPASLGLLGLISGGIYFSRRFFTA